MADHINVESSALTACAVRYTLAGVKLMQCTATYTQALGNLASDWTGKAFAIMSIKVAQMVKNLAESYAKCYDAIKELADVKEQFEEAENALKGAFSSLDTGSSPFDS
jgi:uncharacterized protein YukE